ncbi:hypothetical protein PIB30_006892 [Stylosanthes scabra]|uniref:Ubiquitin-like protease family profile domain-containing protein n=1 Tax=Stylosanthes scabra TaxID=79078 RepID=A0ABU6W679_9FABA|nr:hypothetical protein [Stylosanthes scabra]
MWRGDANLFLIRGEFRFLRPKGWIDDRIIRWRCKEYNHSSLKRFLEDFYCVEVGILNTTITDHNLEEYHKHGTYVGMCPNLGADGKNFDRDKASNSKWWLLPVCNRLHWYLYAFNLDKKELLVLDFMHDHAFDDLRRSLDTYVVWRVIEDILKIVIPTFDHKGVGFPTRYAEVPKQPNNDDCGIYVIKFMEDWKPDSILNEYTNQELAKIRRRLVLEIVLSNFNTNRGTFLKEAYAIPQRRNNPDRGKKKEVKTPFTAPSTKEITRRAEKRK